MTYESFAYLYDRLMEEAPYDRWLNLTLNCINDYHPKAKSILDVGCGTGELIVALLKHGFQVTGVDLSNDMLTVAQEKVENLGKSCMLFEQDMRTLDGIGSFDVVTVFCDSLNYLLTESDVKQAIQQFYNVLNDKGILLFDVHSEYKMNHIFKGATFAEDLGEIAYIWNVFASDEPNQMEHELTFFVEQNNGLFQKIEEVHVQRTFSIEKYKQWLLETNFEILQIIGDFQGEITPQTERIFFIARRK